MVRALVGTGLACAVLIVTVYEATKPIIRANRIEARQQAIFDVLEGATESLTFRLADDGSFVAAGPEDAAGELAFAGFDASGALVGVAVEAAGMGYQDVVRVLYGVSLEREAVIGVRVLESRETPGLGDRVETDERWLANFVALDASVTEGGDALRNAIEFVKEGEKDAAWQIEGITGATITSRAIARMVGESAGQWVPRLVRRRDDFRPESDG
jgi:electron transport complex protein RnfG